jgi:uncharacterized repeat protein (TIGR03803 family)
MFASQVRSSSQPPMGAARPSGLAWFLALVAFGCSCAATPSAQAQTLTVLYNFLGTPDGFNPYAPLIRDTLGNLYGTTVGGGSYPGCSDLGCGTVFELSSNGVETVLHSFRGGTSDGSALYGGLLRDAAGNLYGTTYGGGAYGNGSVFKLNGAGKERKLLYSFKGGADGVGPVSALTLDSAGNLYGTTSTGGTGTCYSTGCGTVFMVSPTGVETVLHSFLGGADGLYPESELVRDAAGNLYGTTQNGGVSKTNCGNNGIQGCGTVYMITTAGVEAVLHSFAGGATDGVSPASVIIGAGGNLYGITEGGGTYGYGAVFELTPTTGTEKLLYSFGGYVGDGISPYLARLTPDGAGNFYGTTALGGGGCGGAGCGTIFKVTKAGVESVVYSFANRTEGCSPEAGLIDDGAGSFYGTTLGCGTAGWGTVFKFTP